jgi:hypothetical protein
MLGAGSVSAYLGFAVGSEALKGVTAPDARPTTKFANNKAGATPQAGVALLRESDIIKTVKERIEGKTKAAKSQKSEDEEDESNKQQKPPEKPKEEDLDKPQAGFPISSDSEGVNLAVQSARFSGGALLVRVKMQNKGQDTVRFLYSFLDVTDDKGRTLSASTEGLPSELPANGPTFSGTVSIPTALLDDVKRISLSLTDYPAQRLKLQVSDIPVER